jgi:hypothetical protein
MSEYQQNLLGTPGSTGGNVQGFGSQPPFNVDPQAALYAQQQALQQLQQQQALQQLQQLQQLQRSQGSPQGFTGNRQSQIGQSSGGLYPQLQSQAVQYASQLQQARLQLQQVQQQLQQVQQLLQQIEQTEQQYRLQQLQLPQQAQFSQYGLPGNQGGGIGNQNQYGAASPLNLDPLAAIRAQQQALQQLQQLQQQLQGQQGGYQANQGYQAGQGGGFPGNSYGGQPNIH